MGKIYVKNQKIFKNKYQMVIYILLFCFFIYLFIYFGTLDYSKEYNEKEYISEILMLSTNDHVFTNANANNAYMVASGKKGIVLFGRPNNEWVSAYASIVNEVAKEVGVKSVYYYDITDDRIQNNGTYQTIVNILSNYVTYNDSGNADLYAPSLLVVSGDEILYFDDETSFIKGTTSPNIYWNAYQKDLKKAELRAVFKTYLGI